MTQSEQALKNVQSVNWHERSEALKYLRNVDAPLECKEIIRLILVKNNVELLLLLINIFTDWSAKFNLEILSLCLARAFELQDHENRKVKSKAGTYVQSFLESPDVPTSLKYETMRMAYLKINPKKLSFFLKSVARYRMLPLVSVIIDQVDKQSNVELCLELLIHLEDPRALRAFYKEINSSNFKTVALAIKGIGIVGNVLNGFTLIRYINHEKEEIQTSALAGLVHLWKHVSLFYPKRHFVRTQNVRVKKAILNAITQAFTSLPAAHVIHFLIEQYLIEENPEVLTAIFNTLVSFPREQRALVLKKTAKHISEEVVLKFLNLLEVTPHPILKPILMKWAFDMSSSFVSMSAMQLLADHDDAAIALQLKQVAFEITNPKSMMAFKALLAHPHVDRPGIIDEFLVLGVSFNMEFHQIILHALKSFPQNISISSILLTYLEQHLVGQNDELKLLCIEAMCYVANEKIVQQIDAGLPLEKSIVVAREILKTLAYAIKKDPSLVKFIHYSWEHETFIKSFSHCLSSDLVKCLLEMACASSEPDQPRPDFRAFFRFHEIEISKTIQAFLREQYSPLILHSILSCVQQKLISMNLVLLDYLKHLDFGDLPYATALIIIEEMALANNQELKQRALIEYWRIGQDPVNMHINFRNLLEKALVNNE